MSDSATPDPTNGHVPAPDAAGMARERARDQTNADANAADLRQRMSVHPEVRSGDAPSLPRDVVERAKQERDAADQATARDLVEKSRDGATVPIRAGDTTHPEFGPRTDVIYVNGINTNFTQAQRDAAKYAGDIHQNVTLIHASTGGIVADLVTCAIEKTDPAAAYRGKPEEAVAAALMAHVKGPPGHEQFEGDVHLAAHSRGALIAQRGLEEFQNELKARGMTDAAIDHMLAGRISAETFGGASDQMPSYVKAVHYVNDHDDVGMEFGQGSPTIRSAATLGAVASLAGPASATLVEGVLSKNFVSHPQGPVVREPGRSFTLDPLASLVEGHDIGKYLDRRQPFEQTYDKLLSRDAPELTRPQAGPGNHAAPPQTSMNSSPSQADVQARVDALRDAGTTLPDVRSVAAFRDHAQTGSFVNLGSEWTAQHCGGGNYQICNVATDLRGVMPIEGVPMERGPGGVLPQLSPEIGVPQVAFSPEPHALPSLGR